MKISLSFSVFDSRLSPNTYTLTKSSLTVYQMRTLILPPQFVKCSGKVPASSAVGRTALCGVNCQGLVKYSVFYDNRKNASKMFGTDGGSVQTSHECKKRLKEIP